MEPANPRQVIFIRVIVRSLVLGASEREVEEALIKVNRLQFRRICVGGETEFGLVCVRIVICRGEIGG